ncbi:MAG: bifunctional methylenetetrahydrofolate dehydrogenase/methenyltetrahydrofolate cyclohydrolase, partial [Gammaproteobacteria bacterium]|nr:bifunctional methylenetetrahydrofolate dehydrogenase/methenyltetrahydrofolate cyclohydrolase [Gammaproteobacteria bacterium]
MIIDGKKIAESFRAKIAAEVEELNKIYERPPLLAVLMVGHDSASEVYVQRKREACAEVGIETRQYSFPLSIKQVDLLHVIDLLNQDESVDGILVQLPLPCHINVNNVLECIVPQKDVDGLHPYNLGRLAQRHPSFRPCTPQGVMALLESIDYHCQGVHAVVVGCSNIVGQPMALELLSAGATVTVCHSHTRKIQSYIEMADLIV